MNYGESQLMKQMKIRKEKYLCKLRIQRGRERQNIKLILRRMIFLGSK
jgi:hypothetical protein